MLFFTLRKANLKDIIVVTPQQAHNLDDFIEKYLSPVLFAAHQFLKQPAVLDEQNTVTITGGKRVMGHHQNGRGNIPYQPLKTL